MTELHRFSRPRTTINGFTRCALRQPPCLHVRAIASLCGWLSFVYGAVAGEPPPLQHTRPLTGAPPDRHRMYSGHNMQPEEEKRLCEGGRADEPGQLTFHWRALRDRRGRPKLTDELWAGTEAISRANRPGMREPSSDVPVIHAAEAQEITATALEVHPAFGDRLYPDRSDSRRKCTWPVRIQAEMPAAHSRSTARPCILAPLTTASGLRRILRAS